ncbi:bifunctional hydroxymethylpyrimidine kinase/phosphomethylpyrimidine kinase [Fodinicurvata sp. EGI_FJ10296]|uniref:bifunctional hydroxymethylpyrimidine kinase/phosphomethylpyrimidine kinase n=1 Tax=Fodinicurvata sp. EGI_FJ10296 TaxID=3231908 RepID=UPI003456E42D
MIPNVLSIAGSDPSGGAGIQADLKAFSAHGAYGMAALTALTAQNTRGVTGVETVRPGFVADQIAAVFDDVRVDAVKIGMIASAEIADAVADILRRVCDAPIVLDPVMVAKGGARLLAEDAIEAVRHRLMPLAFIVTPNVPELAVLTDNMPAPDRAALSAQAAACLHHGSRAILAKGGHLDEAASPDVLIMAGDGDGHAPVWFEGMRHLTSNTHGTGCTLSSAIAARLAQGDDVHAAVETAKCYIDRAIAGADRLSVGSGHGPIHHFVDLWER